ncbi:transcobalamin beta a isoform X2 [Periophthalmus magnuspinnatus]|uniref:transcobalamin beta a isoform X2 n=1 Tax=Periophthalmus magnuspinnatus TaxID=409849 RepID=UPI00145A152F|nr:transcobalamin beta a isoform X2 [Periophthalmus magnuspinnatus]
MTPVVLLLLPLLLLPGARLEESESLPIEIHVMNSVTNAPAQTYSASVVKGGILLGAMKRLMASNAGFKFTFEENLNFGPFLVSVNGLAGDPEDHTYWELLVKTPTGDTLRLDVGIGCYVPKAHEQIILNFNKW